MAKIAFVFSGQGAQYPGMGESLCQTSAAARALYDEAEGLRPGIGALSFRGTAEELKQTVNTQPALYLCDLGAALALEERGIRPAAVAGFSLGELPALAFAGAFSHAAGFEAVLNRARFMTEASQAMPEAPAMAAVIRMAPADIEAVCAALEGVWPANYNAPEQTVVSGTVSGIAAFRQAAAERGFAPRLVELPVSGAFHTPYMTPASEAFARYFAAQNASGALVFRRPEIPAWANLTGESYPDDPSAYAGILSAQVSHPVRWVKEIENLLAAGVDTFVECGPGKTLCGLIRKIAKDAKVCNVENEETLAAAVAALGAE